MVKAKVTKAREALKKYIFYFERVRTTCIYIIIIIIITIIIIIIIIIKLTFLAFLLLLYSWKCWWELNLAIC